MPQQIRACLFDMDGLLINSEDIYTQVANEVLAKYNKGALTWENKIQLQGLPGPEASAKMISLYDLPLTPSELMAETDARQEEWWSRTAFLPGALELLQELKRRNVPIAVCTSSGKSKYLHKTGHLSHGFDLVDVVVTGDDPRIPPGRGKPHPDIYQLGLRLLNEKFGTQTTHDHVLVFEDGVPGVQAGIAAGSHVIWVPHPDAVGVLGDPEDTLQGHGEVYPSLAVFDIAQYL